MSDSDHEKQQKLLGERMDAGLKSRGLEEFCVKFCSWDDCSRKEYSAGGNNITDVRLKRKLESGKWANSFVLGYRNMNGKRVFLRLKDVIGMVSDPDGAKPRMKEGGEDVSLAHIFKNYGKYAKHKGVNELVNLLIDEQEECQYQCQIIFCECASGDTAQFATFHKPYQAKADQGKNALLYINTQGCYFDTDACRPGDEVILCTAAVVDGKERMFYSKTDVTERKIAQSGTETDEQAMKALLEGKSIEAPIGPRGVKKAAGFMVVQKPIKQKPLVAANFCNALRAVDYTTLYGSVDPVNSKTIYSLRRSDNIFIWQPGVVHAGASQSVHLGPSIMMIHGYTPAVARPLHPAVAVVINDWAMDDEMPTYTSLSATRSLCPPPPSNQQYRSASFNAACAPDDEEEEGEPGDEESCCYRGASAHVPAVTADVPMDDGEEGEMIDAPAPVDEQPPKMRGLSNLGAVEKVVDHPTNCHMGRIYRGDTATENGGLSRKMLQTDIEPDPRGGCATVVDTMVIMLEPGTLPTDKDYDDAISLLRGRMEAAEKAAGRKAVELFSALSAKMGATTEKLSVAGAAGIAAMAQASVKAPVSTGILPLGMNDFF